jgi:hypothetical protein
MAAPVDAAAAAAAAEVAAAPPGTLLLVDLRGVTGWDAGAGTLDVGPVVATDVARWQPDAGRYVFQRHGAALEVPATLHPGMVQAGMLAAVGTRADGSRVAAFVVHVAGDPRGAAEPSGALRGLPGQGYTLHLGSLAAGAVAFLPARLAG